MRRDPAFSVRHRFFSAHVFPPYVFDGIFCSTHDTSMKKIIYILITFAIMLIVSRFVVRIVDGPEYLMPEHLTRLKKRSLNRKRSLALRKFALGMESLTRFVSKEPLYRVHECVFGVLAFESEPVDPRL